MKRAVLFVAGRYESRHFRFYRRLARGAYRVAVDGGYRFFHQTGLRPDLLIGDLDSLGTLRSSIPPDIDLQLFPPEKDWTDLELAIDYCLEQKFRRIDIVQPSPGEPDHFLANLYQLTREETGDADIRLYGPNYVIRGVRNGRVRFERAKGGMLSVLPISRTIRLTCTGTEYPARGLRVTRGCSLATRNRVTGRQATVTIKGEALVYCQYPGYPAL